MMRCVLSVLFVQLHGLDTFRDEGDQEFIGRQMRFLLDEGKHILKPKRDVAFSAIFRYAKDPQRGFKLTRDQIKHIKSWSDSAQALGMERVVLHDNVYSDRFVAKHQNQNLAFVEMDLDAQGLHSDPARKGLTPSDWRFVSFYDYLKAHKDELEYVILTDAHDVEFRQDPLKYMRGLDGLMNHKYVYGQEEWRPWEAMYQTYDPVKNINTTAFGRLLHYYKHCFGEEIPVEAYSGRMPNCGILGGHVDVVLPFLEKMLGWYGHIRVRDRALMCDMLVYLRTVEENYGDRFISGYPFHAKFKHIDPLDYAVIYHKSPLAWQREDDEVILREDLPVKDEDDFIDHGLRYEDATTRKKVF